MQRTKRIWLDFKSLKYTDRYRLRWCSFAHHRPSVARRSVSTSAASWNYSRRSPCHWFLGPPIRCRAASASHNRLLHNKGTLIRLPINQRPNSNITERHLSHYTGSHSVNCHQTSIIYPRGMKGW